MPNITGLDPAPVLHTTLPQSRSMAYGLHARVVLNGHMVSVVNKAGTILATVDFSREKPRVKADLKSIDGDTVTPVNAALAPYGKVKLYWRTKEYRWHPVDGAATAPTGKAAATAQATPAPVATPVAPVNPALAPATVVQPRPSRITITPTATAFGGVTVIPTERRHEGKQPTSRAITKTYSQMGQVLVPTTDVKTLETAWKLRAAGRPAGVKITGPAGTAKTLLAQEFAFTKGVPFLVVEGQSIQTAADWYGGFVPQAGGGFEWVWSDFGLALRRGEPMVILIDELNRPENERALNGLMGLMAWTKETHPVGAPEALTLAPGILIMATINEGIEFVGTVEIDAAVNSRFPWGVRMVAPPEPVERKVLLQQAKGLDVEVAKRLVRVAATQRAKCEDDNLFPSHNIISTRDLIEVANAVLVGMTPQEALWANAKSRFQPEDDAALGVLIEAQFGANPEDVTGLADDDDIEQMLSAD